MSCNEQPQAPQSDDQYLLFLASKSGTAALVLSSSAKVLPPAGAAFAQGLALGVAANARIPASSAAGVSAMINSQGSNSVVAGGNIQPRGLGYYGWCCSDLGNHSSYSRHGCHRATRHCCSTGYWHNSGSQCAIRPCNAGFAEKIWH